MSNEANMKAAPATPQITREQEAALNAMMHSIGMFGEELHGRISLTQAQMDKDKIVDDKTQIQEAQAVAQKAAADLQIAQTNAQDAIDTLAADTRAADTRATDELATNIIPNDRANIQAAQDALVAAQESLAAIQAKLISDAATAIETSSRVEEAQDSFDRDYQNLQTLQEKANEMSTIDQETAAAYAILDSDLQDALAKLSADQAQLSADAGSATNINRTENDGNPVSDDIGAKLQAAIMVVGNGALVTNVVISYELNGQRWYYDPVDHDNKAIAADQANIANLQAMHNAAAEANHTAQVNLINANDDVVYAQAIVSSESIVLESAIAANIMAQDVMEHDKLVEAQRAINVDNDTTDVANAQNQLQLDQQALATLQEKIDHTDFDVVLSTRKALNDANMAVTNANAALAALQEVLAYDEVLLSQDQAASASATPDTPVVAPAEPVVVASDTPVVAPAEPVVVASDEPIVDFTLAEPIIDQDITLAGDGAIA